MFFLINRAVLVLGNYDEWWSPIRLLPPEGEMYLVMQGSEDGPLDQVLESVTDYPYDEKEDVFLYDPTKPDREGWPDKIGAKWVGFNKQLLRREVSYDKWERLENSPEWGLVKKDRRGPSIYFQYLMATRIENAETSENFPVDAIVTFTVRIISPLKALFFAGGWEVRVNAAIQGAIRTHIAKSTINDLREQKKKNNGQDLVDAILALDLSDAGLQIVKAEFIQYDLEKGDKTTTDAVRAVGVAELQAEATRKRAEGERDARKTVAEGITAEYTARREAGGEHASTFALAEAIKEARPTAIGGEIMSVVQPREKSGENKPGS